MKFSIHLNGMYFAGGIYRQLFVLLFLVFCIHLSTNRVVRAGTSGITTRRYNFVVRNAYFILLNKLFSSGRKAISPWSVSQSFVQIFVLLNLQVTLLILKMLSVEYSLVYICSSQFGIQESTTCCYSLNLSILTAGELCDFH